MKTETIQKTIEILKEEENAIYEKVEEAKKHYPIIGNFKIFSVDSWYSGDVYRVKFKHNSVDLDFEVSETEYVNRLSWSSWSYSQIKPESFNETLEKSKEYVTAVIEMLAVIEDKENTMKTVNDAITFHKEQIIPLKDTYYSVQKEIEDCERIIKANEKNELLEEAKKLIVNEAEFYLYEKFRYNSKRFVNTTYIKIKAIEKGKHKGTLVAYDSKHIDYASKFKLDDETMIALYKHITKEVVTYSFDAEYRNKHCKKTNNMLTKEMYENKASIVWEDITQEEFNQLCRN